MHAFAYSSSAPALKKTLFTQPLLPGSCLIRVEFGKNFFCLCSACFCYLYNWVMKPSRRSVLICICSLSICFPSCPHFSPGHHHPSPLENTHTLTYRVRCTCELTAGFRRAQQVQWQGPRGPWLTEHVRLCVCSVPGRPYLTETHRLRVCL